MRIEINYCEVLKYINANLHKLIRGVRARVKHPVHVLSDTFSSSSLNYTIKFTEVKALFFLYL